jgi:hypothetical protein
MNISDMGERKHSLMALVEGTRNTPPCTWPYKRKYSLILSHDLPLEIVMVFTVRILAVFFRGFSIFHPDFFDVR